MSSRNNRMASITRSLSNNSTNLCSLTKSVTACRARACVSDTRDCCLVLLLLPLFVPLLVLLFLLVLLLVVVVVFDLFFGFALLLLEGGLFLLPEPLLEVGVCACACVCDGDCGVFSLGLAVCV